MTGVGYQDSYEDGSQEISVAGVACESEASFFSHGPNAVLWSSVSRPRYLELQEGLGNLSQFIFMVLQMRITGLNHCNCQAQILDLLGQLNWEIL